MESVRLLYRTSKVVSVLSEHSAETLGSTASSEDVELNESDAEFVRLFSKNQRRLFLYILSQLGNAEEAEEVLQETNLVIWAKRAKFEAGTNFLAWVYRIASYEIMKSRQRHNRQKLHFNDELVQQIAQVSEENLGEMESRQIALRRCLGKLRAKDRELITKRYRPNALGKDVAEATGRPSNSVYQSLGRIRRTLMECIRRELAMEARG